VSNNIKYYTIILYSVLLVVDTKLKSIRFMVLFFVIIGLFIPTTSYQQTLEEAETIFLSTESPLSTESDKPKKNPNAIKNRYIVVLKDDVSFNEKKNLVKTYGIIKIKDYSNVFNGFLVDANEKRIEKLRQDPRVELVSQDVQVQIQTEFIGEPFVLPEAELVIPTGIQRINADITRISNANVIVMDTGGSNNVNINRVGCINFIETENCEDGHGHSTHVAGTIGACGDQIIGVAPCAKITFYKVLNSAGLGTFSGIISAFDDVVTHPQDFDVINMSLGGFFSFDVDDRNCGALRDDAFHIAFCKVIDTGIVIVVAGGNNGDDAKFTTPAGLSSAFTVSALADFDGIAGGFGEPTCRFDEDDTLANFSNFGSRIDIMASGVCIISTWLDNLFNIISGTSMSAPHATGMVALYIEQNGKPTNREEVIDVMNGVIALATPMNDVDGWLDDGIKSHQDIYPERLLNAQTLLHVDIHDVAIVEFFIPAIVPKGVQLGSSFELQNKGDFVETFNYIINDVTDDFIVTQGTLTLIPNEVISVSFKYDTTIASANTHELNLSIIDSDDQFLDNNSASAFINVVSEGDMDFAVTEITAPNIVTHGEIFQTLVTFKNFGRFFSQATVDVSLVQENVNLGLLGKWRIELEQSEEKTVFQNFHTKFWLKPPDFKEKILGELIIHVSIIPLLLETETANNILTKSILLLDTDEEPPPNQPPDAINDSVTVNNGDSVLISVTANDLDPDGDKLTIQSFTQPSFGVVTETTNNRLIYNHDSSNTQSDNFSYTITDGFLTDSATVFVTINPPTTPPPDPDPPKLIHWEDIFGNTVDINENDIMTTITIHLPSPFLPDLLITIDNVTGLPTLEIKWFG